MQNPQEVKTSNFLWPILLNYLKQGHGSDQFSAVSLTLVREQCFIRIIIIKAFRCLHFVSLCVWILFYFNIEVSCGMSVCNIHMYF